MTAEDSWRTAPAAGKIVVGTGMLLPLLPAHLNYVEMEQRRDPAEGDP